MNNIEIIFQSFEIYLVPIMIVVAGIMCALIFDKFILKKLSKITTRTGWDGDDIFIKALSKVSRYPIIVLSIYLASKQLLLTEYVHQVISKITMGIMVFYITIIIARIAVGFVKLLPGRSDGAFPGSSIFINVTRICIYIFGFIFLLQQLGISITPAITALGVGGLAVALALQDTLANLFAGLNVIAGRRLRQGDYVQLENGQEGIIDDITWRNTVIREPSNNNIIVPNTKMASSIIRNYTTPLLEMMVVVKIGLDYSSDLEKMEKILIDVAREVMLTEPGAIKEHEPFVRFKEFGDYSISCEVFLKAFSFSERPYIRHIFIKKLHQELATQGIQLPYPTQILNIKNVE